MRQKRPFPVNEFDASGRSNRVVMLAYSGVNLLDVSGPLQAFQSANRIAKCDNGAPYELALASSSGGEIESAPGVNLVTRPIAEFDAIGIDTLIIPGGSTDGVPPNEPFLSAWIAARQGRISRICSVCTGAFILAASGVLDGRRATTHWRWGAVLSERYPAIQVADDPIFTQDGAVWTSAGVTAGIDLTLALITADLGHQVALAVARDLVVYIKRPGGQSQYSAPLAAQELSEDMFSDLHAWMSEHLHEDLRIERLAKHANMSPRNFGRIYFARMGVTPASTVESMRLEAARHALENTQSSLKRIAREVGCGDEQNLRRLFQRKLGIGALEYRERFSDSALHKSNSR